MRHAPRWARGGRRAWPLRPLAVAALGAGLAVAWRSGVSAQAAVTTAAPPRVPASAGTPKAEKPASPAQPAAEDGSAAARSEADAAAAVRATQDLETALLGLRQRIEAQETARAAVQDLERRLDLLEQRFGKPRDAAPPLPSGVAPGAESAASLAAGSVASDPTAAGSHRRDGGFFIRSSDGFHLIQPTLRVVPRFEVARVRLAPPQSWSNQSAIALRWAQLGVEGHAYGRAFEYRLAIELASGSAVLLDGFGQIRFAEQAALRVGRFRVPYGFQASDLLDGRGLVLTDLAAPSAAFSRGRDVGAMLLGKVAGGRLEGALAGLAGGAPDLAGSPRGLGFAARLVVSPWGPLPAREGALDRPGSPRVAVGGSVVGGRAATDILSRLGAAAATPDIQRQLVDRDGDGRIDDVGIWQVAGELRAVWRRFALQAEYFHRWERFETEPHRSHGGGYVQASVVLRPEALELAARVARTDWPHFGATASERAIAGAGRDEQAVGLTTYLRGHDVKVQGEYAHRRDRDVASGADGGAVFDRSAHLLRLQAHFAF